MVSGGFGEAAPNMLYANVHIRSLQANAGSSVLNLKVVYAGREYQDIIYLDVLFSRLDESCQGFDIVYAEELMLDDLVMPKHQKALMQFLSAAEHMSEGFLTRIYENGYRYFAQYDDKGEEYLIVAKRLFIGKELLPRL
jgi:hypothetical protein